MCLCWTIIFELIGNHLFKIANLFGHGDVKAYSLNEIKAFCNKVELKIDHLEASKNFRMHLVARKWAE